MRRPITKTLTVETAARIHRAPLDDFLAILRQAVASVESGQGLVVGLRKAPGKLVPNGLGSFQSGIGNPWRAKRFEG